MRSTLNDEMCRLPVFANVSSSFFNMSKVCDLFQVIRYCSMTVNLN